MDIAKLLGIKVPLILASQSPRRKKLLTQLGLKFSVHPADIDESKLSIKITPAQHVKILSLMKAEYVAGQIHEPAIIIGSDTIVVLENKILGKPINEKDAERMLKLLSGKTHIVYTGIALVNTTTRKNITAVQKTEVTFRKLTIEEIQAYIRTGSPMDKAGAYGIQDDFGAIFIEHINGCYYNIVGLPLELLYKTMKKFNNKST
ncbi:MAG: Maf family protein [FCB group bacterium]|jgi:septum formation protein